MRTFDEEADRRTRGLLRGARKPQERRNRPGGPDGSPEGERAAAASRARNTALSRRKGKQAERQARLPWIAAGWDLTRRQPGSGSLRPYGARDSSPFPADLHVARTLPGGGAQRGPFLVEVKHTRDLARPSGRSLTRGWDGTAFVRGTVRALERTWWRALAAGGPGLVPVLQGRSDRVPWTWWVPGWALWLGPGDGLGMLAASERALEWVGLPEPAFFALVGSPEACERLGIVDNGPGRQ